MDYRKMIIEMVKKIDNEEALKIIHDFVKVPYDRKILKSDGRKNGLQKNDY